MEDAASIINAKVHAAEVVRAVTKPKAGGRVIQDPQRWLDLRRNEGGLTPQSVTWRLNEADRGRMGPLVDLANAMRQKDGHLQGILEARETAVQQLPWELELAKKPTKKEKKAAQFVADVLGPILGVAIAHCSSAPFFGYAVTETVWRKSGGYLVPDCFVPHEARRFDRIGRRVIWDDHQGGAVVDVKAEYPSQFIVSMPRVTGDIPAREGLMRVLVWAALFRNWTLTDWLRLGEIAWKPWRLGSYDRSKFPKQEDVDDLVETIDQMSTSGVAVLSDAVKVDVKWPTGQVGSGNPHETMFSTMGREMSKAVLGQTETTEASKSSGYAQGKVHYEVKLDKRDADAAFCAADITRDLVAWMVLLNFGANVRPPALRFITQEAADLQPFGQGVKALKEAGLRMPAKWARDKAGIPEPAEGEELVGDGIQTEEATPEAAPAGPENEPEGSEESEA